MKLSTGTLLTAAIIAYCAWNAANLFSRSGIVFEEYAWVALLLWIIPMIVYFCTNPAPKWVGNYYLLGAALLTSFLSALMDLHVLAHIGFALSLISLMPLSWQLIPWYLSALVWMPAFSYFGAHFFAEHVLMVRFTLIVLCSVWATWILLRETP